MRVSTETLEGWKLAAARERLTLSQWVREACAASQAEVNERLDKLQQARQERAVIASKAAPGLKRASSLVPGLRPEKASYEPDFK
jgi:hypothetical protein